MVPDAVECEVQRKQQFREDCSTCLLNVGYTPHDKSVKRKEDKEGRTEGGSDNGRIIGVEEIQATVEALVQKALESAGTQHKVPVGNDSKPHDLAANFRLASYSGCVGGEKHSDCLCMCNDSQEFIYI